MEITKVEAICFSVPINSFADAYTELNFVSIPFKKLLIHHK